MVRGIDVKEHTGISPLPSLPQIKGTGWYVKLVAEHNRLIQLYGSYLATQVFEKERKKVGRIRALIWTYYGKHVKEYE